VILNTPSNPSGAVIPREEIRAFVDLCRDRSLVMLFDECYDRLVYSGSEHVSPFVFGAEGRDVSIVCGSCSKTYAMTGWRVGYAAGPRSVIGAMARMQSHTTSNVTSISQYAALEALKGDQSAAEEMAAAFAARRDALMPMIRRIPGFTCGQPAGAFYVFPNVESLLGGDLPTAADLCTYLIDEAHVVTVPGTAFGRDGYLRLSFATSLERLEEGVDRLERACDGLAAG
jgi:aspartate aminotransferase